MIPHLQRNLFKVKIHKNRFSEFFNQNFNIKIGQTKIKIKIWCLDNWNSNRPTQLLKYNYCCWWRCRFIGITYSSNYNWKNCLFFKTWDGSTPSEYSSKNLFAFCSKSHTMAVVRHQQFSVGKIKLFEKQDLVNCTQVLKRITLFHNLQDQVWLGNQLDPEDWGYKLTDNGLEPVA